MSVISGIFQSQATEEAAETQADAATTAADSTLQSTRETNDLIREMYNQGRSDTAPWRSAGANALKTLQSKIAAGPGKFTTSPGYTFQLSEGKKAVERSASARGNVLSGATLKGLEKYSQGVASGVYQNFLANYYQSLNPYLSLAQLGQVSAGQSASLANQTGSTIAANTQQGTASSNNALMTAANAIAQGRVNSANALANMSSSTVSNVGTGLAVASYLGWL